MAEDVSAAPARIENALQRFDRHVLERSLQPGIPAAAVEEALSEVGLPTSPELVSLYGWRDGVLPS